MNNHNNPPHTEVELPVEDSGFRYRYSAKEQAELKRIREKYTAATTPSEPSTMERIRRLDARVTKKGTAVALIVGIVGTLTMGVGMSLIMTDIKCLLGAYEDQALMIGIIIGFIGMVGVIVAYPLYQRIVVGERKKVAPEILRLTDELLGDKP